MKTEYFILFSIFLISFLSFLLLYFHESIKLSLEKDDAFKYIKNLEEEIQYISKNLNKKNIFDFLQKFSFYLNANQYNFSFVCIIPKRYYDSEILLCNDTSVNCCYLVENPMEISKSILKFCNISFLLTSQDILCVCYNISSEGFFYASFICV